MAKTNIKIWLLVVSLGLSWSAVGQERKIKRSDLPAAVEKTVVEQSKGATIRGFSEEKENGQTTYEAEMLVNGHTKDVSMDANGVLQEIEEQVDLQARLYHQRWERGCKREPAKARSRRSNRLQKKGNWLRMKRRS